jgi:hypothetical protein
MPMTVIVYVCTQVHAVRWTLMTVNSSPATMVAHVWTSWHHLSASVRKATLVHIVLLISMSVPAGRA